MPETTEQSRQPRITLQVAIAGLLVLLIFLPVFIVRFVLTPEWIEENVVPEIERTLGRDVDFDDISLGFRGLSLEGLVVAEDPAFKRAEPAPFAELDRLVLRVKILPLLSKRLEIREILLGDPLIVVHRNAEGRFNFESLTGDGDTDDAAAAAEPAGDDAAANDGESAVFNILADRIRLQNAHLIFIDEFRPDGAANRVELTRFNLAADGFSLEEPFEATAYLTLIADGTEMTRVEVAAQFEPLAPFIGLDVEVGTLDIDRLVEVFGGGGSEDTEAAGDEPLEIGEYHVSTRITADRIVASGVDVEDVDCEGLLLESKLTLRECSFGAGGGKIAVNADVDLGATPFVYNADIDVADVELDALGESFDVAPLEEIGGSLGLRILIAGAGAPDTDAWARGKLAAGESFQIQNLDLDDGSFVYPYATASGSTPVALRDVELESESLKLDERSEFNAEAELAVGDAPAVELDLAGSLDLARSTIATTLGVGDVDLDAITAALGPAADATAEPAAAAEEIGPIETPYAVSSVVDVRRLTTGGLAVEDFHTELRLGDGKLTVTDTNASIADGSVAATATVDLARKGLGYRAGIDVREVDAAKLVAPFWSDSMGTLTGTLSTDVAIDGAGTTDDAWRRNLTGKGNVAIDGGSFRNSALMGAVGRFTGLSAFSDLDLEDSGGPFTIGDGRWSTTGIHLGNDVREVRLIGDLGLDGKIDLELRLRAAPTADATTGANAGASALLLTSADGWKEIPVAVGGTLDAPRPSFPKRAVADRAKELVPKLLTDKLLGGGEDGGGQGDGAEAPAADPNDGEPEEPLGRVLQGLGGLLGQ